MKQYVSVTAKFDSDGNILPIKINWDDGRSFDIANNRRTLCRIAQSRRCWNPLYLQNKTNRKISLS